jgi:hypothetical protein
LTTLKTRWKSAACWRDGCGFAASFELCVLASHTSRARRRRAPVSRRIIGDRPRLFSAILSFLTPLERPRIIVVCP